MEDKLNLIFSAPKNPIFFGIDGKLIFFSIFLKISPWQSEIAGESTTLLELILFLVFFSESI